MLNSWRFVVRSLRYYWRTNLAIALGVVAATAVLTGALLVGDSVRGSLRELTLERLGRIDEVLISDHFFRAELVSELTSKPSFSDHFASAQPAILLPSGTVETSGKEAAARAGQVQIVGVDSEYWMLATSGRMPREHPSDNEVILNEALAQDLEARIGDRVTLRLPDASQIPADSTLGQKSDRVRSLPRLEVIDILPPDGLGRFSLQPNQRLPKNAYVSREALAEVLEEDGRVNAILVAGKDASPEQEDHNALIAGFAPTLDDLGLKLERIRATFPIDSDAPGDVIYDYYTLTTDRMILDPVVASAAQSALSEHGAQPVLTYLADAIKKEAPAGENNPRPEGVPYSTITAIESSPQFPLLPAGAPLGEDEIVLNQWTAEQLGAAVGDTIVVSFFQPETIHGEHILEEARFTLRAIVPLTEPAQPYQRNRAAVYEEPPTLFNDPQLTPVVKGITDQESIEDWDAPFPFDISRMQDADDEYWENHRTTPKAFVNLVRGQLLWGSRFGSVTAIRIPAREGVTLDRLTAELTKALREPQVLSALGMTFVPVKAEGLAAARGTTPFDGLFLGLSFFIILSAVLLVVLMFRLGVDRRAAQLGLLSAIGFEHRMTARYLVTEGAVLSAAASLAGVVVGVGYAALMLAGLKSWWIGAIVSPFLNLHVTSTSLVIGYFSGALVSVLAIYASVRRLRRVPPRRLLAGQTTSSRLITRRAGRAGWIGAGSLLLVAVLTAAFASQLSGVAQAGAFVGGGALLLAALLILLWNWMRTGTSSNSVKSLWTLSASNAVRNPTRSVLTIGLVSAATFLIVAMGAFRLDPTLSGSGGFRLVARSSTPLFVDLNQPEPRKDLLGARAETLSEVPIFSFRVKPGDDASCRNLYSVTRPQVFGVPADFASYYDSAADATAFTWASHAPLKAEQSNPWHLLSEPGAEEVVPVILDNNTALYSLKWTGGVGSTYTVTYEGGQKVQFRIVGLLSNSVLQGALLIDEDRFRRVFPDVNGYQFFLIGASEKGESAVRDALEDALGDQGFDVTSAQQILEDLLAVQNTYLSTFQSLGALGLLLGTFGLATVQLRSVLERRGELALLRAQGFRRQKIGMLVLLENTALLLGGLGVGVVAALCAVVPHMVLGGASIPLGTTFAMLATVLIVGTLAGLLAVRASVRLPLVASLRVE